MKPTSSGGTIVIRPAKEDDAAGYRDLRLEALRNHPEAFSDDYEVNLSRPMTFWTERLRAEKADRSVLTCLAFSEQKLIGTGSIVRPSALKTRHSATIVGMYVKPDWRGRHIAERLVEACVDWARTEGSTIVKLAVISTNTPAIRCYARCGFQVYGIEPQALHHVNVYYDDLLMARNIGP